jgi:hypothetical protein
MQTDVAPPLHPPTIGSAEQAPPLRLWVFLYNVLWLFLLLAAGVLYIGRPQLFAAFADGWRGFVAISVWFAILGGVAISFKGVYDHYRREEWTTGGWTLWYIGRPLSGAIVGVMVYVLLRVLNSNDPAIPALAVAAFTLGTQEKRFFTFLAEVASLVLTVPSDLQTGLVLKGVQPDHGPAGIPVLVLGQGIRSGATVTLGGLELGHTVVSPDGTSAAGSVPAGIKPGPADVVVTNPDGAARVFKQAFAVRDS